MDSDKPATNIADISEAPAEASLFKALGNPIRRSILRLTSQKGYTSYTELRDNLHLEPGTLYFHLEQLMTPEAPLIIQDQDRRYVITPLGRVAAAFLSNAQDVVPSTAPPSQDTKHPRLHKAAHILGLAPLFRYLRARPDYFIVEAILTLALIAYATSILPLVIIGVLPLDLQLPILLPPAVYLILSWFCLAGATELITRFRYKSVQGFPALLTATPFIWLPTGLYLVLRIFAAPLLLLSPLLMFTTLFITITWSLWIHIQAITHTKRITPRKAALATIIITNITLLAIILIILILP